MTTPKTVLCPIENQYGFRCYQAAVFEIYWQQTGADAIPTCAQHTAKAIRQLRRTVNQGAEKTFKIHVLES